nr:MAG TPA: hypothetical protein [Caudoviricetes sp.]
MTYYAICNIIKTVKKGTQGKRGKENVGSSKNGKGI